MCKGEIAINYQFIGNRFPYVNDNYYSQVAYCSWACDSIWFWPIFCGAISTVTIAFKLADIKPESTEAYMLKLGKNLSWDFEVIFIFRKNEVLNICWYLKSFYTYKKINNIFLKFHHYLLRMQKVVEMVESFILKNSNQKHNQHAYK